MQETVEQCVKAAVGQEVGRLCDGALNNNTSSANLDQVERHEYYEARRAMKMWPVRGSAEDLVQACREFMVKSLELPNDTAAELGIVSARKVKQARRSRIENEVLVKFRTIEERDIVQSYATNLAKLNGAAGIRMEIPAHLRQAFQLFETHGSLLRQRFSELKRSIKFDDEAMSLVMDVRLTAADNWERISVGDAQRSRRERENNGTSVRANPGGKAGRKALMLPSPGVAFRREDSSRSGSYRDEDEGSAWSGPRTNSESRD